MNISFRSCINHSVVRTVSVSPASTLSLPFKQPFLFLSLFLSVFSFSPSVLHVVSLIFFLCFSLFLSSFAFLYLSYFSAYSISLSLSLLHTHKHTHFSLLLHYFTSPLESGTCLNPTDFSATCQYDKARYKRCMADEGCPGSKKPEARKETLEDVYM